jgi:hypothetical protein
MKTLVLARDDRYCPIETFLTFNRLRDIGATADDVRAASRASAVLEVDGGGTAVRTVVPFRPDPRRDMRTVHIERLAGDETLESLQGLFRAAFGTVLRVEMRHIAAKGGERTFAGAANVELDTEEAAQRAVAEGFAYRGEQREVVLLSDFKESLKAKTAGDNALRRRKPPRRGK